MAIVRSVIRRLAGCAAGSRIVFPESPTGRFFLAAAVVLFVQANSAFAVLRVPAVFSDHMVLQAGRETAFWGWTEPGKDVGVAFLDAAGAVKAKGAAKAGADGRWAVKLHKLSAGAAGTLKIQSEAEEKSIADVLVGEVWLGSGQSNMAYQVAAANVPADFVANAKKEAEAAQPQIRFFQVVRKGANEPAESVEGRWVIVTPETVGDCSATAWYFAQALHQKLQAPVGMIVAAWGGTPVEAWMPREALDATSVVAAVWKRHDDQVAKFSPEETARLRAAAEAWDEANPTAELKRKNANTKPEEPYGPTNKSAPTRLFNGMIHGLAPYTLQGILWYQGEANARRYQEYGELIKAMIPAWRKLWGEQLPLYYVELAGLGPLQTLPVESPPKTAYIREAQAAALQLPKTGVATAVDLGMVDNIHPPFKKPLGQRLAGLALAEVYGKPGLARSPQFAAMKTEGGKIRITLENADGLRARKESPVKGFAICGADGTWKWAEAEIAGTDVMVWTPSVPEPRAVRYGWAGNPILSLENSAGLPLRPFRTDPESAK